MSRERKKGEGLMSSPSTGAPDDSFHNRLNRVAEVRVPNEEARPVISVLPDWKAAFVIPIGIGSAILVGMLSVIAVRVGFFHATGAAMIGNNPNMLMAIETVVAMIASFVLFFLFPYKGTQYNFLQFFGVVIMISMMHNLVHKAPGLFGLAFSPEWTETVTIVTEPNSFFVRGQSVLFVTPDKKAKVLPPVNRG